MGIRRSLGKKYWIVGCAFLVVLVVVPNVFGQEHNPRLTIFGGGSFLKGERTFPVGGETLRSNFASGGKLGFRGTWDLDNHWAVEGAYGYGTNNLRFFELAQVPPRERAFGVRVHQFTGNVLYFLGAPDQKLRPFATAGLGFTRFNPTSGAKAAAALRFVDEPAAISGSNELAFNFGVGAEAKAADWLGVRFDFRDHMTRIPRFGVPDKPTVGILDFFPVSGPVHDLEISVGIVIYFK